MAGSAQSVELRLAGVAAGEEVAHAEGDVAAAYYLQTSCETVFGSCNIQSSGQRSSVWDKAGRWLRERSA